MNIQAAKDQIKDTIEAYLQRDEAGLLVIDPLHQRPIFLVGAPGIGKTAIIEQIARELGLGAVSYSMTHHTRQSALGLPRIVHRDFEGFEFEASEYTMSEIVGAIYDYMERTGERRGILFLDEINCVSETLYPSMLQFLQFKTFGRHRVPDDWVIVCAGNPPEYNKSVHEFDVVTLDRLREIDVEPDYGVWKRYATEKGLHPAVTTFLEAKPDCFYTVESKPGGGKSFVTARGWEDLAEVIALYESLGKPCDRDLFVQFLRDDDIADRFAVYYELFQKYRSDYQVGSILAGEPSEEILSRARNAQFDERIALLGLLLDALGTQCADALRCEAVAVALRDELRAAKPLLLEGGAVEEAVGTPLRRREAELERRVAVGTIGAEERRRENLALKALRRIMAACALEGCTEGPEAFAAVNRVYREEVDALEPQVKAAQGALDNAFDFLERVFGSGREMVVFVAELSTRLATTQFVAHFGSDSYYRHNDELQVDETRRSLGQRVRELSDLEGAEADAAGAQGLDMGGAVGLARKAAPKHAAKAAEGRSLAVEEAPGAAADGDTDLEAYYRDKKFEFGFSSQCKMTLPNLAGKRVLDVGCRRGMGVYKLSARVGAEGHVIGVDWVPGYIAEAKAGSAHAQHRNHLRESNMEFHVAYPEDLLAAGIGDRSVDAIYVNNMVNLVCDTDRVLREFNRVLKPGGLLICETVFAEGERPEGVRDRAREMGNSIQAAGSRGEFLGKLEDAGFGSFESVAEFEVAPNRGVTPDREVEVVPGDEGTRFTEVTLHARKDSAPGK